MSWEDVHPTPSMSGGIWLSQKVVCVCAQTTQVIYSHYSIVYSVAGYIVGMVVLAAFSRI